MDFLLNLYGVTLEEVRQVITKNLVTEGVQRCFIVAVYCSNENATTVIPVPQDNVQIHL